MSKLYGEWAWEQCIGWKAKFVLFYLVHRSSEDWTFSCAMDEISAATGLSRKDCESCLSALNDLGLISQAYISSSRFGVIFNVEKRIESSAFYEMAAPRGGHN